MCKVAPEDGLYRRFFNTRLYDVRLSEVVIYVSLKHAPCPVSWFLGCYEVSLCCIYLMWVVLLLLYS